MRRAFRADPVAFILAAGFALAVNLVVLGFLIETLADGNGNAALGDNATTVLTTALGGLIGVLGYRLGATHRKGETDERDET
jgi:hypothetical protein